MYFCFREHAMLAKTAGVKHLVVLINKMDDPTVEWHQERWYIEICCIGVHIQCTKCRASNWDDTTGENVASRTACRGD